MTWHRAARLHQPLCRVSGHLHQLRASAGRHAATCTPSACVQSAGGRTPCSAGCGQCAGSSFSPCACRTDHAQQQAVASLPCRRSGTPRPALASAWASSKQPCGVFCCSCRALDHCRLIAPTLRCMLLDLQAADAAARQDMGLRHSSAGDAQCQQGGAEMASACCTPATWPGPYAANSCGGWLREVKVLADIDLSSLFTCAWESTPGTDSAARHVPALCIALRMICPVH